MRFLLFSILFSFSIFLYSQVEEEGGREEDQPKYTPKKTTGCISGNCQDGYGTYKWSDQTYVGDWKNGKRHGWGTYVYNDGATYSGFWEEGKKQYFGTYYWKDGTFFIGVYKDGSKIDHGVYVSSSGKADYRVKPQRFYKTGCVIGNCNNGMGVYFYSSGNMYAGLWKNGKKHFWGGFFWQEKDFFLGQWKDDQRMKKGIYVYDTGKEDFRNQTVTFTKKGCVSGNCQDGYGLYIWDNGDFHFGGWKNGKQHFWAAKFWPEDFFFGIYKDGTRKKHGLYCYEDGKPAYWTSNTVDFRY